MNKEIANQSQDSRNAKVQVHRFDIFKGLTSESGKVEKVCSVGHSTLYEGSTTYSIYLKMLIKDIFYLLPEQDVSRPFDFVILTREASNLPGRKYFWNRVGIAKLLSGQNSGMLKLDFDLFAGVDLFLSFHSSTVKEMTLDSNPAA